MMASLWRPGRGVEIKEIDDKRYIFAFNHPIDMKRVLDGGPWQFERNLLIVKEIKPTDIPHKICLNEAEFCVRIHNVPHCLLNLGTARRVGNFLGRFISYDKNQLGEKWKSYLRVRVCINVENPLNKGTTLKKEGIGYWVDFQYEKLPNFCFICGVIGHSEKSCPPVYEEGLVLEKMLDVSLRAGSGMKTSPTGKNKWLVGEGSNSGRNSHYWENQGSNGGAKGEKEDTAVLRSSSSK
ncbi:unnamed protein product [Cuscuta epithymum]|uniref:CCHC-type domain-containing protein n=1 Tax=Cuscuta epithymum TaxID=186058 RepID=A0AAV0BYX0_9ASTE|nr:unnamed protein product [Cuscuta epithymum]